MKILVSNDDGVHSPGIHVLAEEMKKIGEVFIISPDRERNATGHSVTLHKPLRIEKIAENVYSVNGTPTDCVILGINEIIKEKPDLIISGINKGGNLGEDITYSGTVSAAMEGTILGIKSMAVSQVGDSNYLFKTAATFAGILAKLIIEKGLPPDVLLNVNCPNLPENEIKGFKVTCLGKRVFEDAFVRKVDPRGKEYFWIGGKRVRWDKIDNCDFEAVDDGYISITPINMDMTDYKTIKEIKKWVNIS